jgi:quercetin dioxygenase-like cupin family protein
MEHKQFVDSNLMAKAAHIASLVDYQSSAVVSRTIIEHKTGTVTLFAFDEGQALGDHTSPFDAMVHIIEGKALITIAGKSITLKAGEVTIMPENQPHGLKAASRFKMLLVMIRGSK